MRSARRHAQAGVRHRPERTASRAAGAPASPSASRIRPVSASRGRRSCWWRAASASTRESGRPVRTRSPQPSIQEHGMNMFTNQGVVVTAGKSGIGLAPAREFPRCGAWVVISGRDERTLAQAAASLGGAPWPSVPRWLGSPTSTACSHARGRALDGRRMCWRQVATSPTGCQGLSLGAPSSSGRIYPSRSGACTQWRWRSCDPLAMDLRKSGGRRRAATALGSDQTRWTWAGPLSPAALAGPVGR
jgi:hypothetical protein